MGIVGTNAAIPRLTTLFGTEDSVAYALCVLHKQLDLGKQFGTLAVQLLLRGQLYSTPSRKANDNTSSFPAPLLETADLISRTALAAVACPQTGANARRLILFAEDTTTSAVSAPPEGGEGAVGHQQLQKNRANPCNRRVDVLRLGTASLPPGIRSQIPF